MYTVGNKYQIDSIIKQCEPDFRRRLLSMGFLPGTIFEAQRIAPFGGPIQVKIKGTSLALRQKELALLAVSEVV